MPDPVAEMEYRILLEFKPADTVTRNKLGMVLFRLNKVTEAENEFAIVLKCAPEDFDALDAMGLVKFTQNRNDEAAKYFTRALAVRTDDPLIYFHLGQLYEKQGRLQDAKQAYQTALEKNRLAAAGQQPATEADAKRSQTLEQALQSVQKRLSEETIKKDTVLRK